MDAINTTGFHKTRGRYIRSLLLWTVLVLVSLLALVTLMPPSEDPKPRPGRVELWTAQTLALLGVRNAWIDDVLARETFTIVDIDAAAMEFDTDLSQP
jgi:hypothetical protein